MCIRDRGFKGNVIQQILRFHQTAHGVVFVGNRRRAVKGFPDEPFFIIVAVGYRIAVSVGGAGRQSGLQIKGISCERAAANGYAGVVSIAVISKGIAAVSYTHLQMYLSLVGYTVLKT